MPLPKFWIVTGTVVVCPAVNCGVALNVYPALKSVETPVGVSSGAMPFSPKANSFCL